MKSRGRKHKAIETVAMNPNMDVQREGIPPVNPTPINEFSPALQHFITLQNTHLTRLRYLFPEINPAALRKFLDLCQGDFIRTIDNIIHMKKTRYMSQQKYVQINKGPAATSPGNNMNMPSFNTSTPLPPFSCKNGIPSPIPVCNNMAQNSANMSPIRNGHFMSSDKYCSGISDYGHLLMGKPMFHRPNPLPLYNNNLHPNTPSGIRYTSVMNPGIGMLPSPAKQNVKSLPSFEQLQNALFPAQSERTQLNPNEQLYDKSPKLGNQQPVKMLQQARYQMASNVTQRTDLIFQAEKCTGTAEQSKDINNQVLCNTTPEIFAQRQQGKWLEKEQLELQKEKPNEDNQLLELMDGSSEHWQKLLEQDEVPIFPLPIFEDPSDPVVHITSTAGETEHCEGLLHDEQTKSKLSMQMDSGIVLLSQSTEPNYKCKTGGSKKAKKQPCQPTGLRSTEARVKRKLFENDQTLRKKKDSADIAVGISEIVHSETSENNGACVEGEVIEENLPDTTGENGGANVETSETNIKHKDKNEDCTTSTRKRTQCSSGGNNSWGYFEDNPSSAESSLVIDTDPEVNSSGCDTDKKK